MVLSPPLSEQPHAVYDGIHLDVVEMMIPGLSSWELSLDEMFCHTMMVLSPSPLIP
jgi:hypothetical protein